MGTIADGFSSGFRDYATDGDPSSGAHRPVKADLRALGVTIEAVTDALSSGVLRYEDKAALDADTGQGDGTLAYVTDDGTANNNGIYVFTAGSPGSWAKTALQFLDAAEKGAADGVATLTSDSKLTPSQNDALRYQGEWDASANDPTIPAAATANRGHYYVVSAAGTTTIDGKSSWSVGDWIASNGSTWDKINNGSADALEEDVSDPLLVLEADGQRIPLIDAFGGLHLTGMGARSVQDIIAPLADDRSELLDLRQDLLGRVYSAVRADGGLMLPALGVESVQEHAIETRRRTELLAPFYTQISEPPISGVTTPATITLDTLYPASDTTPDGQQAPVSARAGNREWCMWHCDRGEDIEGPGSYLAIAYSDDDWQTSNAAGHIAYSDLTLKCWEPHIWYDAERDTLWLFWSTSGDDRRDDGIGGVWAATVSNPRSGLPVFSQPFQLSKLGQPTVVSIIDGVPIMPLYRQPQNVRFPGILGEKNMFRLDPVGRRLGYISTLPQVGTTYPEVCAIQLRDGSYLASYRTTEGTFKTTADSLEGPWSTAEAWSALGDNAAARIWLGRTPQGRLCVAYNATAPEATRSDLTIAVSEDDGDTFKSVVVDNRAGVSYPYVSFDSSGNITGVYDRDRQGDMEINFFSIPEDDVWAESDTNLVKRIINTQA